MYLTKDQINKMAQAILTTMEVTPLDHGRKCEIAQEYARDEFGVTPRRSAVLLAVKIANAGWVGVTMQCQKLARQRRVRPNAPQRRYIQNEGI